LEDQSFTTETIGGVGINEGGKIDPQGKINDDESHQAS
jgi:hypothetical protein